MIDTPQNTTERGAARSSTESRTDGEWDTTDSFKVALVSAIESATGRDATDLSPLYEQVDIESVEAVLSNSASENVSVIFSYEDCFVEVRGSREITVTPFQHVGS